MPLTLLERMVKKMKRNKLLKKAKQQFPFLALDLVIKPLAKLRFTKEKKLFNRGEVETEHDLPSLLFFTVHKCASTLVVKLIRELSAAKGYVPIDLDGYLIALRDNDKSVFNNVAFLQKVFHPRGIYYGALRYFRKVPDIEQYRVLLVLRDPRDVVTSMYFSVGHSHTIFSEEMMQGRKKTRETSIDDFVLKILPNYKRRYEEYIENVLPLPGTLFLKYEEMIVDFKPWLDKLSRHLGIFDPEIVNRLSTEVSFEKKQEDISDHIRNIQPGDHLRKLQPETITILNREFKDVLTALDYQVRSSNNALNE